MKALREIGIVAGLRFVLGLVLGVALDLCMLPQIRAILLRLLGAKIGRGSIVHDTRFINFYRGSFANLTLGDFCFIGEECLIDLAGPVRLGDHVTLASRVTVMTHMNVGYADHPLKKRYPRQVAAVEIGSGSFIGVCSTILAGVSIGAGCLVAAGAVVTRSVDAHGLVAGVPGRRVRDLGEDPRAEQEGEDDSSTETLPSERSCE